MPVQLEFLGHSSFLIDDGQHKVLIDPFLTGNPVAKKTADEIKCGHIVLTHGHDDHFADAIGIAKANNATVYGTFELVNHCHSLGVDNGEPGNPGGKIKTAFGYVAFTHAIHSASLDGKYMGATCGVVIQMGDVTIYHAGDTDLFSDMKLIGEIYQPTVALLPAGDRFTMGPELASRAADYVGAKYSVPIHYNTFPMVEVDISKFQPTKSEVKIMTPGEVWAIDA